MTENIPPSTSANGTTTTSSATDPTRGVPYYEQLKRKLTATLDSKRQLDRQLANLEDQIYRFEASYLEETSAAGNIIRGFDNYIKASGTLGSTSGGASGGAPAGGGAGGGGTSTRRRGGVTDQDRIFSRSSVGFMRESSPSGTPLTGSNAGTPTVDGALGSAGGGASNGGGGGTIKITGGGGGNKNSRKKSVVSIKGDREDDGGGEKTPKRLKISYGRGGD